MSRHSDLFNDTARWQSWLDVESALATVQSELGIIPRWAAMEIKSSAKIENLDKDKIITEMEKTGSPVFALVHLLADICGEAGKYVHFGATTQNIIETGRLITLKKYHKILLETCTQILEQLKVLASEHAETVMVGRTQLNHALPITFGFKLAGWINDFILLIDRITDNEKRLFLLRFGGAVGAFHSFGPQGQEISEALAKKLKLKTALVQGRTSPEGHLEYILNLCSFGQFISKVGNELYFLQAEGINELFEDLDSGTVGSSTMPHKVNSKHLLKLRSNSSTLVQKMASVMVFTNPLNEGDASSNNEITEMINSTCPHAIDLLHNLGIVFERLRIDKEKMTGNARSSQYFTATEALQMELAKKLGKLKSHDIIHRLSQQCKKNPDIFLKMLKNEPEIQHFLSDEKLTNILQAENNIGDCRQIVLKTVRIATVKISDLNTKLYTENF